MNYKNYRVSQAQIDAHLSAIHPECRWCFGIDGKRVKGKLIKVYNFPDATLMHLECPRCGGEFTNYFLGCDPGYITERVRQLHTPLEVKDIPAALLNLIFLEETEGKNSEH